MFAPSLEEKQGRIHGNSVADGLARADMHVFTLFDSCSPTDGRADGRTDGQGSYRVACPQLKKLKRMIKKKRVICLQSLQKMFVLFKHMVNIMVANP